MEVLNHNMAGGVVRLRFFTPISHQAWQLSLSWLTRVCSNVHFVFKSETSMQAFHLARY